MKSTRIHSLTQIHTHAHARTHHTHTHTQRHTHVPSKKSRLHLSPSQGSAITAIAGSGSSRATATLVPFLATRLLFERAAFVGFFLTLSGSIYSTTSVLRICVQGIELYEYMYGLRTCVRAHTRYNANDTQRNKGAAFSP